MKAAVALALGLLVGFEREWSNKDIGVRTFAMTALLGLLATPASALSAKDLAKALRATAESFQPN